jgi:TPR repeat protein
MNVAVVGGGSTSSTIDSAKAKLETHQFPLADLPRAVDNPLWKEMRTEFGLTLSEVSALQNFVYVQQFAVTSAPASSPGTVADPPMIDEDFSMSPAKDLHNCLGNVPDVTLLQALLGPGKCFFDILPQFEPKSKKKLSKKLVESVLTEHRKFIMDMTMRPDIPVDFLVAIRLFTLEEPIPFYAYVNTVLNSDSRDKLAQIAPYMRILTRALYAMEDAGFGVETQAYRGLKVADNASLSYKYDNYKTVFAVGKLVTLTGFTSVSIVDTTSEAFGDALFFQFLKIRGVNISSLSKFPRESEILVVPPGVFRISAVYMLGGRLILTLSQEQQRDAYYLKRPAKPSIASPSTTMKKAVAANSCLQASAVAGKAVSSGSKPPVSTTPTPSFSYAAAVAGAVVATAVPPKVTAADATCSDVVVTKKKLEPPTSPKAICGKSVVTVAQLDTSPAYKDSNTSPAVADAKVATVGESAKEPISQHVSLEAGKDSAKDSVTLDTSGIGAENRSQCPVIVPEGSSGASVDNAGSDAAVSATSATADLCLPSSPKAAVKTKKSKSADKRSTKSVSSKKTPISSQQQLCAHDNAENVGCGTTVAEADVINYCADQIRLGHESYDQENPHKALQHFRAAAATNLPISKHFLGNCYYYGIGVKANKTRAAELYRSAAEQGCAEAQLTLGTMYRRGDGVVKNPTECLKWMYMAAEQGNNLAQYNLAVGLLEGDGIPMDKAKGIQWLTVVAENGDTDAQVALGKLHSVGDGIPQNFDESVKWLRKAAEQKCAEAFYQLGIAYFNGRGVHTDKDEAVVLYHRAAEQGYSEAELILGHFYCAGTAVTQDVPEGVKWYRRAAEHGSAEAMGKLAFCYLNGFGVPKNFRQAIQYYVSAAAYGDVASQRKLQELNSQIPK